MDRRISLQTTKFRNVDRSELADSAEVIAKEVDEDTFYHTRESGGTRISSAYKVARDIIHERAGRNGILCRSGRA